VRTSRHCAFFLNCMLHSPSSILASMQMQIRRGFACIDRRTHRMIAIVVRVPLVCLPPRSLSGLYTAASLPNTDEEIAECSVATRALLRSNTERRDASEPTTGATSSSSSHVETRDPCAHATFGAPRIHAARWAIEGRECRAPSRTTLRACACSPAHRLTAGWGSCCCSSCKRRRGGGTGRDYRQSTTCTS